MKILLTAEQLSEGVERLAQEVAEFYQGRPLTILGVLTGAIVLVSDLIRRVDLPLRIGFVQASSYRGPATSPQDLVVKLDAAPDLSGRHVLIVDDIFDTGYTMTALVNELGKYRPASLRSMVLLRKHGRKAVSMEPDHVGFEIPNEFVVGYGLDYHDGYRNLPYVAALEQQELGHQE
ncbi:MAG TPA: hypoxanthine phosphoribosyltransferase [Pirellulales bacterium]|nr:hypoxanthine phosphoribosyltransferase [Pirellulales bacterium]